MSRIISSKVVYSTPWMQLVEKEVSLQHKDPELYYCVKQPAYVSIFAQTEDGRVPLVRQFRPCVETSTWEFPGGTVDEGETPECSARREIEEETGLCVRELIYLGDFYPDTGRLQVDSHAFFAKVSNPTESATPEIGLVVRYVTVPELNKMIVSGVFKAQLHLGVYFAAILRGIELIISKKPMDK